MNLKKNARAKVAAVLASLVALFVGWGLVHQNAPVTVAANTASTTDAAPAQNSSTAKATSSRSESSNRGSKAPMATKRHVRTHVS